jgi:hypothetical protein
VAICVPALEINDVMQTSQSVGLQSALHICRAPNRKIVEQIQPDLPCLVLSEKIFFFSELKIAPICRPSRPLKGCFANVTNAGWDAVDAAASGTTRDGRAGEEARESSAAS